jgi:hypothetical protein
LSASLANVPPTNVHTATPAANDADQGRARSSVYSAASVAGHDTPLIAERAARAATEGGDERTGARRDQFQRQFANARGERRDQGARSSRADRRMWDGMRAGGDAPLIDERAATRGRLATEGGDEAAGACRQTTRAWLPGDRRSAAAAAATSMRAGIARSRSIDS